MAVRLGFATFKVIGISIFINLYVSIYKIKSNIFMPY
jgi:hypothetical protein